MSLQWNLLWNVLYSKRVGCLIGKRFDWGKDFSLKWLWFLFSILGWLWIFDHLFPPVYYNSIFLNSLKSFILLLNRIVKRWMKLFLGTSWSNLFFRACWSNLFLKASWNNLFFRTCWSNRVSFQVRRWLFIKLFWRLHLLASSSLRNPLNLNIFLWRSSQLFHTFLIGWWCFLWRSVYWDWFGSCQVTALNFLRHTYLTFLYDFIWRITLNLVSFHGHNILITGRRNSQIRRTFDRIVNFNSSLRDLILVTGNRLLTTLKSTCITQFFIDRTWTMSWLLLALKIVLRWSLPPLPYTMSIL